MKTAVYKHSSEPNFIVNYTGFKGGEKYDLPQNEPLDFTNKQEPNNLSDQLFLPQRIKKIISNDPKKMMFAVAFVFNNLEKKGSATVAIDFIGPLADVITICSLGFKVCKIVCDKGYYYMELEYFLMPKINLSYFNYYFDNNLLNECPFLVNPDREKIRKIFTLISS